MGKEFDFTDDEALPVSIVWSKKYAMPVFIVGNSEYNDGGVRQYIPDTGEYAGYFTEVSDLVAKASQSQEKPVKSAYKSPPSGTTHE